MEVLLSTLAFLLLLTVLVLLHELGHFAAARFSGVTVEEFGFGLPPRLSELFSWGETLFTLNWVPFGGFVRLKGENALSLAQRYAPGSFGRARISARIVILIAGVAMNLILAFTLFTVGFSFGKWVPTYRTLAEMQAASERGDITLELSVVVEELMEGGSAKESGVGRGSVLARVDDVSVSVPEDVVRLQQGKERVAYTLIDPNGEEHTLTIPVRDGKTGVLLRSMTALLSVPERSLREGLLLAVRETYVVTERTVLGIGQLFVSLARTGTVPEGITGIVGIAQLTHASVQEGFMTYLRLVALLSLSLAVLNILPLPALDGGRLLFVIAEVVRHRPTNRRFELTVNTLGFSFLIVLILLITFYDVLRILQ